MSMSHRIDDHSRNWDRDRDRDRDRDQEHDPSTRPMYSDFDLQQVKDIMTIGTSVARIEAELNALSQKMDSFISSNNKILSRHEERIHHVENRINSLEGSISAIKYVLGIIIGASGVLASIMIHMHF